MPWLLVVKKLGMNTGEKVMFKFGEHSLKILSEIHPSLQLVLNEAIKVIDFSIICGRRNKKDQDKAFTEGKSKLEWPNSKHNVEVPLLSRAVDISPYRNGLQWNDKEGFTYLAGIIKGIAHLKGIPIRWGGDFNRDNDLHNDRFVDMPHFELEGN